jgi:hypothetical protein
MASVAVGCQTTPPVSVKKLELHRETIDVSGLKPSQIVEELRVSWSVPSGQWTALPVKKTPLYVHQQWKSPTASTGIGVAHIKMPLALPASFVIWFAKNEYIRRTSDPNAGRLISEWTDSLGRQWFEAEDSKYHVKGYAIARGSEAWIVYSGYRVTQTQKPGEIAVAERSLDSVVPMN